MLVRWAMTACSYIASKVFVKFIAINQGIFFWDKQFVIKAWENISTKYISFWSLGVFHDPSNGEYCCCDLFLFKLINHYSTSKMTLHQHRQWKSVWPCIGSDSSVELTDQDFWLCNSLVWSCSSPNVWPWIAGFNLVL